MPNNMGFQVGDWVKQYRKGIYQIVGFFDYYYDLEPDGKYMPGQYIGTIARLRKGFTETRKYSLCVDCCVVSLLKKVSDDTNAYICKYFMSNPQKKKEFEDNRAAESVGIHTFYIYLTDEQRKIWEKEILKLPKKFTATQFRGFCSKRIVSINEKKNKKERNNRPYIITCELCEEPIELGKMPMYHNPMILLEK